MSSRSSCQETEVVCDYFAYIIVAQGWDKSAASNVTTSQLQDLKLRFTARVKFHMSPPPMSLMVLLCVLMLSSHLLIHALGADVEIITLNFPCVC